MVQSKISSVVKIRSLDEPDWSGVVAQAQQALVQAGLMVQLPFSRTSLPACHRSWQTGWLRHANAQRHKQS
jgi:hypothetical protein